MRLMVCPRTKVLEYQDAPVTHLVTLFDPGETEKIPPPKTTKSRLELTFSDLDDVEIRLPQFADYEPPKEKDMLELIDFGRTLDGDDCGLLANCEAGISRSTAAAITMLTAAGYRPQIAFGLVRKVCPEMLPNRRMLRMADEILQTGGWLRHMAENHRKKMFLLAGYEDPTEVLAREAAQKSSPAKGFLARLLSVLPAGWRNLIGSGARARAAIEAQKRRAASGRNSED
jgi:predicted protein tyrosine phosphatase